MTLVLILLAVYIIGVLGSTIVLARYGDYTAVEIRDYSFTWPAFAGFICIYLPLALVVFIIEVVYDIFLCWVRKR